MTFKVSYVDFSQQYAQQREKILDSLDQTMASGQYILGEAVQQFEKSFAQLCQTKYAIGVANGTDALTLALKSLNLLKMHFCEKGRGHSSAARNYCPPARARCAAAATAPTTLFPFLHGFRSREFGRG